MQITTRRVDPDSDETYIEVKSVVRIGGGDGYRGRGKGGCTKRLPGLMLHNYLDEELQINKGGYISAISLEPNEMLLSIKFSSTKEDEDHKNMTRKKYESIYRLEFHYPFILLFNDKEKCYTVNFEHYRISSVHAKKLK